MLYFAYGSNLEVAGMRARCPAAVALGRAELPGHGLVFRPWADVEPRDGTAVAGGLWRITPACLAALDLYEEVEGGLYRRGPVLIRPDGGAGRVEALCYRMTTSRREAPEPGYLATVLRGYRDFGLDEAVLLRAARLARRRDAPS